MLARRARTGKSWDLVLNFRTCDLALSSLITFNRADASTCATRRRAFGAVGPSRTNLQTYSEDGNGWNTAGGTPPTVTAATTYVSQTCVKLAFASTITPGYANSRAERTSLMFPIVTGTTYSTACFVALSRALVGTEVIHILVTGDAAVGQINITADNCAANVGGFSRVLVPSGTATANGTDYFVVYPGAALTADLDVYVTKLSAEAALFHTPYIPTAATAVTTTDWPRTNYIGKSNKFSSALWGRAAAGTGALPTIVSEVVPSPTGSLDATRITFDQGTGDTLSDSSQLDYYQAASLTTGAPYCAGIWARIPLGSTIAVRSVGASGYMAMVGTGEWKRYPRPENAGSAFAYLSIGLRGGLGIGQSTGRVTVDLWHCTLEPGSELTATIPNDTNAPLTVNTPPFGQLATVASNVPQLEYDKDGIGRGLRVDGAATQLLATTKGFKGGWYNNGAMTGWVDNYGVAPDGTITTTLAPDGSTAYELVSATIGVPLKFSVFVRAGTANMYRLYADEAGLVPSGRIDRFFGTHAVDSFTAPVTGYGIDGDEVDGMQRVWFEVTPTATGNIAFHIYPINGTAEFWGANVTTGPLTSYIEGQFTRAAASAVIGDLSSIDFSAVAGSVLCEIELDRLPVAGTYPGVFKFGSSDAQRIGVYLSEDDVYFFRKTESVSVLGALQLGRNRIAVSWGPTNFAVCVNGGAPTLSAHTAGALTAPSSLALASFDELLNSVLAQFKYATRELTIAELVRESAL